MTLTFGFMLLHDVRLLLRGIEALTPAPCTSAAGRLISAIVLLTPSTLIALLLAAGTVLLITQRFRRWALACAGSGTLLYLVLGSGWTASWLLGQLEFRHPAAQTKPATSPATAIVVLTGYAQTKTGVPITGQLNRASAVRILEAARLFTQRPLPVHISGYHEVPHLLDLALRSVAAPGITVQVDAQARSTYESAVNLQPQLQARPFYLVTSAGHMPRSVAAFESLGMRPIAAPTDFLAQRDWYRASVLPEGQYLEMSDLAIHEYAGMLWYRFRGRL